MSEVILGVDPGKSGALAFLDTALNRISVVDMPVVPVGKGKRNEVCASTLFKILDNYRPDRAFIEDVWSLPSDGHVGAFSFGDAYGTIKGAIGAYGVGFSRVLPNVWKKNLKVPADKVLSRARAQELFPDNNGVFRRVRDDGRAESAMIALYGFFSLGVKAQEPFSVILGNYGDEDVG